MSIQVDSAGSTARAIQSNSSCNGSRGHQARYDGGQHEEGNIRSCRNAHHAEGSVSSIRTCHDGGGSAVGENHECSERADVIAEQLYDVLRQQVLPVETMVFNPRSLKFSWRGVEPKLNAWFPDRIDFWRAEGRVIAWRNLFVSQLNLMVGFAVWLMWSIIVVRIQKVHDLDPEKFSFGETGDSTRNYNSQLYLLPALAGLSGGTFRITNSFIILPVGGRVAICMTTLLLIVPCALAAWELGQRNPTLEVLAAAAMLSGIGGGAFATSMSNISYFFPGRSAGFALGLNGGIGNLGVSLTQIMIPLLISGVGAIGTLHVKSGGDSDTQSLEAIEAIDGSEGEKVWVGAIAWIPFCAASALAAWLWLNDMPHHGNAPLARRIYYYFCMEGASVAASAVAGILLFATTPSLGDSPGGQLGQIFLVVLVAIVLAHGALARQA